MFSLRHLVEKEEPGWRLPGTLFLPRERREPQTPETYMLLHFPEVCAQKEGAEPRLSFLPPPCGLF